MILQATSAFIGGALHGATWLEVKNGGIASVNFGTNIHADKSVDATLIPAFIDIHCHGGAGSYFASPIPANIESAITMHGEHGTVALLASLVTASLPDLHAQIRQLISYVQSGAIAGIHLEGPYLSRARCGAHDPQLLRIPDLVEIQELISVGGGTIKMMTIAPELPGAIAAISYLKSLGVIIAIGHSDASAEIAGTALDAGATVITHFTNAMPKLIDGESNVAKMLLDDERANLELILDKHHVDEKTISAVRIHAPRRVILVTDAMAAAGSVDGNYEIGSLPVRVEDGIARLKSNDSLAGSTLTMNQAFLNFIHHGASLESAVHATSTAPAKILGLTDVGSITVGKKAALLAFNPLTHSIEEV